MLCNVNISFRISAKDETYAEEKLKGVFENIERLGIKYDCTIEDSFFKDE